MVESAGRPEEAASLRLRAGRRDPDGAAGAVDFLRAGRMYSEMGRWEAAHAAAAEGIARLPQGNDGTRRQLLCEAGAALIEMGRAAEAVPMLREAAAIGGGEAAATRAMALLARALEADGHPEQSLETYLRIGYLYPLTEEAPARAWLEAGRLLEGLGRWSEVRTVYTRVASEAPVAQAEEASRRLLLLEARP
jgi:tetratricopeptide (TPR) repeat protein